MLSGLGVTTWITCRAAWISNDKHQSTLSVDMMAKPWQKTTSGRSQEQQR